MKRLNLLASLLLAAAPALAQQQHPITASEFVGLDRPSEPAISPDGHWIVYTVTTADLRSNRRRSDLWLVSAEGGVAQKLSDDSLGGRSARWSPDGRQVAYINSRGGTPQVWTYDLAYRTRRQITSLSTGADGVIWAPNGRTLAFASEVYPDCANDDCNRARADADAARPSKARIYDGLLFRHWNAWEDGLRSHLFVVDANGGQPRDLLAGKDYDTPVPPFGGSEQYAWAPDSRSLAFTTKLATHDQAWNTNLDIYTVRADSAAEPVLVTLDTPGAESNPAFSRDGHYLAFLSQARAGFESDRQRLMAKDLRTGQVREVTHDWDDNIAEFAFLPGGNDIVAISERHQRHVGLHIVFQTGDVHQILTTMDPGQMSVATQAAGAQMAVVSDALDQPPQVYSWTISHQAPRAPLQLTHLNGDRLGSLAMSPGHEFSWIGANGDTVFGLIVTPPGFDPARRYPAVILIHGGPQGAWLDQFHSRWNAQMFAAPGYVVAMLNPRGSTGFGQRFVDDISRDWGGKVFEDIMRGTDAVARLPYVDSTRMAAAGGSYGGYMVNWLNGHTDRFKAMVSHDGVFNLEAMAGATEELWFTDWEFGGPYWVNRADYERFSPHRFVQSFHTPTLVVHGALDYRVPDTEGIQMFTALQRQNVPSRLLYFPDEGHWVLKPQNQIVWWNAVQDWLARYLGRPAS